MPLLEQSKTRYFRNPRLLEGDGCHWLYVLAWESQGEALYRFRVEHSGEFGHETVLKRAEALASLLDRAGGEVVAGSEANEELHAWAGPWECTVQHEQGRSRIVVSHKNGLKQCVWDAPGLALAPALALWGQGVWIAFHHNWREDQQQADITKWIELRYLNDAGELYVPAGPMPDIDRDAEGEEQGFEFPSLALGKNGTLGIFGRGSHCFWWQCLGEKGFESRKPIEEPSSWGCRGRRVVVSRAGDCFLSARRERKGIVIDRHPIPNLGDASRYLKRVTQHDVVKPGSWQQDRIAPTKTFSKLDSEARVLLFGDIHQHSAHSDGVGGADEPYWRARFHYGDDFCALTDHESFLGKRIGPGEWQYLCSVTNRHHVDEQFVTLFAYEWTAKAYPGPGHKVVYLSAEGGPVLSRDELPSGQAILQAVNRVGGFAVPHHVGWTGADLESHNEYDQPVWEICSCHGCYEYADHPLGQRGEHKEQMVLAALKKGYRFGFIACSDSHGLLWHHGMARKRDPFRTGLTVVQAQQKTREGILSAIRERRCYATSGSKMYCDFRVDGAPMGSVVPSKTSVQVELVASTPSIIERVVLVGDQDDIAIFIPNSATIELCDKIALRGSRFIYARIECSDGEMAWLSPVFFNKS